MAVESISHLTQRLITRKHRVNTEVLSDKKKSVLRDRHNFNIMVRDQSNLKCVNYIFG